VRELEGFGVPAIGLGGLCITAGSMPSGYFRMVIKTHRLHVKVTVDEDGLLGGIVADAAQHRRRQLELLAIYPIFTEVDALRFDAVRLKLRLHPIAHMQKIITVRRVARDAVQTPHGGSYQIERAL
jgi:hypothetical protein